MAEVFSVVAAGIGLAKLSISSSAKLINLIRIWRRAPALIIALANETADMRVLLEKFHEGNDSIQTQLGVHDGLCAVLELEFGKVDNLLNELSSLVDDLTRGHSISRRKKWIKLESQAAKLQSQLRAMRININDLFVTHLVSSASRVELRLQDISIGIQRGQKAIAASLDNANQQLQGVDAHLAALQSSISTRMVSVSRERSTGSNNETSAPRPRRGIGIAVTPPATSTSWRSETTRSPNKTRSTSVSEPTQQDTGLMIVTLQRPQSLCTSLCPCDCHRRTNTEIRRTFRSILGTLFIGYCGFPVNLFTCNVSSCENRKAYHFTATYVFPLWLVQRALHTVLGYESGHGLSFSVTLKGRVPGDKSRLIAATLAGDLNVVNRLLRTEQASLMDIDYEFGWTALHWAASSGSNPMLCKLLINAGIDSELEDDGGLSAREIAAFRILSGIEEGPHLDELAAIFNISTSYLDEIGLTTLHRAALGVSSVDLKEHLNTSRPNSLMQINQQDNLGYAPLHWAVQRNNIAAIRQLIQAGADVNSELVATAGIALSWAVQIPYSGEFMFKLLDAGVDIEMKKRGAWRRVLNQTQNGAHSQLVYELLARGTDLTSVNSLRSRPLLLAAYRGNAAAVQHLIDAGAVIDAVSTEGDSAIGVSVLLGRTKCFRVLYRNGADYTHVNKAGESILHIVARSPNIEMMNCLADTWMPGLDLVARSNMGLTAMQYFAIQDIASDIARHAFWRLQRAVEAANHRQAGLYEDDSDQEVFFDAMAD
ncbi:ankyrin [Hypoxylon sp. EC38]|nr:ankyrin [Hypoxylon sp. EC38]